MFWQNIEVEIRKFRDLPEKRIKTISKNRKKFFFLKKTQANTTQNYNRIDQCFNVHSQVVFFIII